MTAPVRVVKPTRRSQRERSEAMERRLLDATIETLVERGYAATTTLEVQARAGVSRGGLLHHFGSRNDLILAAIDHLARIRHDAIAARAQAELQDGNRIRGAIGLLWDSFSGPLFQAALELWLAARHDPELRAVLIPQERKIGAAIRDLCETLFGSDYASRQGFDEFCENLINMMRGASVSAVLRSKSSTERLVESWIRYAHLALEQP